MGQPPLTLAAVLLYLVSFVLAHGDDHGHDENTASAMGDVKMNMNMTMPTPLAADDPWNQPSYSGLTTHTTSILVHVTLMVLAWLFILPVGVVLSRSRSRYALPVQFLFLILNGVGVLFGTIYNVNTPDLYENNAHHKIGWVATWVMGAQVFMSLLFLYSGRTKQPRPSTSISTGERAAFLPVSIHNMAQHNMRPYHDYRWSGDSGQGTERSSIQHSRDMSPTDPDRPYNLFPKHKPEGGDDDDLDESDTELPLPQSRQPRFWRLTFIDRFLTKRVPSVLSSRLLRATEVVYEMIDCTILILGFIALATGGVTYAGIFKGNNVFNGLAHFVKGGIFFWYGLLTLGRWMGCFAELGWAWNIKPTRSEVGQWEAAMPSAEFVESFVIFLYGISNVFLEHLAAWGAAWSAQDLEHVSISIMFFGGGLCGMLVESRKIRQLLNTSVDILLASSDVHPGEMSDLRQPPKTYGYSLNPMPALIILLLGIMMSSHHQNSMVSTMVHKQWGTLLVGFSLARGITYIVTYISPPTSVYPARPPSELVSAFCLISGGLIFMASSKDIVKSMEERNLMAMFIFTVMMGFTAFLMAYEILVLALKGWATRKELKH